LSDAYVYDPKTPADRKNAGRALERVFSLSLIAIQRLEEILLDENADRKQWVAAARLLLERTVPKLQHVTFSDARQFLPLADGEVQGSAATAEGEEIERLQRVREEADAKLRELLAADARQGGSAGLVLLRGNGNGRRIG